MNVFIRWSQTLARSISVGDSSKELRRRRHEAGALADGRLSICGDSDVDQAEVTMNSVHPALDAWEGSAFPPRDTFIKTPKDQAGITIPLKSKSSQH